MSAQLTAQQISVTFKTPEGESLPALGPLSFEIAPGVFVALLGPSGCGKTTLVRVFAGLQLPTHGAAYIDDQVIAGPSPRIGLMFQDANLLPWRTVLENIALPLELAGVAKTERHQAAADLIPVLGLEDFEQTYPAELSGGMAQRVALGRVLIQQPDVLLLDEPLGALDALTREKVSLDLLQMWSQRRQTVLMVTHDINEAVLMADRVLVMSQRPGHIVADIPVNLPRPRQVEQVYLLEFAKIAKQTRAAIDRA